MKNKLIIMLLFAVINSKAQNLKNDTTAVDRYNFEAGVFVPMGNLKEKIGLSQIYSFYYSKRIEHKDILDLGFSIIVPKVENAFNYRENDSVYRVKSRGVNIMLACRIQKQYAVKNIKIQWISILGLSFFNFEDKINPQDDSGYYTNNSGQNEYRYDTNIKGLTSFFIGQGIGFKYKKIGFSASYNFTPYYWFQKKIDPNFGNSSLIFSVSYNFKK